MPFLPSPPALDSATLPTESWYGPVTVTLPMAVPGDPFDAEGTDVRVRFVGPDGTVAERLAYWDGKAWRATLLAPKRGRYAAMATLNGKPLGARLSAVTLTAPMRGGFVRRGGPWGLRTSDGKGYWPMGHNLAWSNETVKDLPAALRKMGDYGADWARIWMCAWDGKSPYMTPEFVRTGAMNLPAFAQWDAITKAAEEAGVPYQMTLFYHGPWSSDVNTNWPESPWNAANGGFLAKPEEFFTNDRAKRLARSVLRYAVARYGASPAVMGWELFNEVEWTDGIKRFPEKVGAWHDEMARYLRSLDPYGHLVLTSSKLDLPIWREADVYEPHGYPPSVGAMVLSEKVLPGKPFFFGEVGPSDLGGGKPIQVASIRGGIWNALFAGHAGAAQMWDWGVIEREGLGVEWARARAILTRSGVLERAPMPRKILDLDAGSGADLALNPGGGWKAAEKARFDLPGDASAMGLFPTYYQGRAHREMRQENATFAFAADRAGQVRVAVTGISDTGGALELRLDGKTVVKKEWAAGAKVGAGEALGAPFGVGRHTLELVNDGPDWVSLGSLTFGGIGPKAEGVGAGDGERAIARLQRRDGGSGDLAVSLAGLGLKPGRRAVEVNDLDTGTTRSVTLDPSRDRLRLVESDAVIVIR